MKVPTQTTEAVGTGPSSTSNDCCFTLAPGCAKSVKVSLGSTFDPAQGFAYFSLKDARQAASFFTNLANVMEGKPQQ